MIKNKNFDSKKINYNFLKFDYILILILVISIILLITFSISFAISILFILFLNKLVILLEITNMSSVIQILLASLISIFIIIKYPLIKTDFGIKIVDKLWISSYKEILWKRHWIEYTKIINLISINYQFEELDIQIKNKINSFNKIIENYLLYRL